MRLSVIVPVWKDTEALSELLADLDRTLLRVPQVAQQVEILVVQADEGIGLSATVPRAGTSRLLAPRGRGMQLNAGTLAARGEWLWLLHVDSKISTAAIDFLLAPMAPGWGRFDVRLDVDSPAAKVIAAAMNARSRLTGICTGDQGLFVHRSLLNRVGGVPQQSLMEDIELSRRLRRLCRPLCPRIVLVTSARRWLRDGTARTVLRMWWLRLRYWAGVSPEVLAHSYYPDVATTNDV